MVLSGAMAEKRNPTCDIEAVKAVFSTVENPTCPETGQPMFRDVRPMTITYKGHEATFDMPG